MQPKQQEILISEQNQEQRNSKAPAKNKRRTRKDKKGRDFFCACGKSYLSYPALYTHIKGKHQGDLNTFQCTPPKPDSNNILKPSLKSQSSQINQLNSKDFLQNIRTILYEYFEEKEEGAGRMTEVTEMMAALNESEKNFWSPLLQFWAEKYQKEESGEESEEQNEENEENEQNDEDMQYTADCVFAKFLYQLTNHIGLQCSIFMSRLLVMIRRAVCTLNCNINYCAQNTAFMVPTIFNQLIKQDLLSEKGYGMNPNLIKEQQELPLQQVDAPVILGDKKVICNILALIANWLYHQNFTYYAVTYKQKEQ